MAPKSKQEAQQPLILRAHRLMEAFTKSDDERDFYLDRIEGFIIYVDLDKPQEDIDALEKELTKNPDRYCLIPKLTFYEAKKIMEGFVNEKVYDIDTKEKLLDIIQSKEARSNFLEFIYDHHSELEKWQQYYQERSRIRIIEWLRNHHFHFVFEEDLDLARNLLEKLKQSLFETKIGKDVLNSRKMLISKAKSYYSNEALNPRPKRGRPPKQAVKQEIEPQISTDIYLTVSEPVRPFLFIPDISSASAVTFSSDFGGQEIASRRSGAASEETDMETIQQKLAALRTLSSQWVKTPETKKSKGFVEEEEDDEDDEEDEDEDLDGEGYAPKKLPFTKTKGSAPKSNPRKEPPKKPQAPSKAKPKPKKSSAPAKPAPKSKKTAPRRRIMRPVLKANAKPSTTSSGKKKHKRIMPVQRIQSQSKPLKKAIAVTSKSKNNLAQNKKLLAKKAQGKKMPLRRI